MHEGAITRALVDQVLGLMPGGARLVSCTIEVGTLEHLDAIVMTTMWTAMTDGTTLAGGALDIEHSELRVRCGACGGEFTPDDPAILVCPSCSQVRPEVLSGSGIVLKQLEIETD